MKKDYLKISSKKFLPRIKSKSLVIENGISKINGGFQILVDLDYPDYLLQYYKKI